MIDYNKVRNLLAEGKSQRQVAKAVGCAQSTVSDISSGKLGWTDDSAAKVQELKDNRSVDKARLRVGLRAEYLYDAAIEVIEEKLVPLKPGKTPTFSNRPEAVQETAVLILSDGHHDQVVHPDEVGGLERYNFDISCRRAETLTDATIKFCTRTLSGYQFDRLVILSLGDSTSGLIHDAERKSHFRNQFKNCLAIGALHAGIVRDLAAHFPQVDVVCVSGNHGRCTDTKEFSGGSHNNWDYMVSKTAAAYCASLPNVQWLIPDAFSTVVPIHGYRFHISHGDDIAGNSGNPWTGLRKRHERHAGIHRGANQSVGEVDAYIIGHHHTRGIVNGNGVAFICNGAWLRTDPYAYIKLGVAGPPEQILFGVHPQRGITWQLPINLLGNDSNVDCRYDYISKNL